MRATASRIACVLTALVVAGIAPPAAAADGRAGDAGTGRTLVVETRSDSGAFKATLTIHFDDARGGAALAKMAPSLIGGGSPGRHAGTGAAAGTGDVAPASIPVIYCGTHNYYSDSDGTMTISPRCDLSRTFWIYKISAGLGAIIVSPVYEHGLIWDRNGRSNPQQAPHVEPWDYQFHGTFNPTVPGDTVDYVDEYTFTVEVAGQPGQASLTIGGSFTLQR